MNRPTKAITLLLTVVLTVTGCTSSSNTVGDRQIPSGGAPLPAGAVEVTSVKSAPTDADCVNPTVDPTASLRPTGPPPAPDNLPPGTTMAKIRAQGKLIVGVDQNTYRFGFRNPITGHVEGFDLDMARAIAKAIFGDENKIQLRILVSSQRVAALKNGDVNLVVQTMTINCERRKDIEFSSVYYLAGQKVLVKKDSGYKSIADLGGKRVCASEGSTSLKHILDAPSKPIGVSVPGWTDCLVMLQQNQVEAVSTDDTILAGLAAQDPFTKVVGPTFSPEPYGIGIPKGQPEFVRFVNAVLDQMRANGDWAKIYNKWLPGPAPAPPAPLYRD